MLAVGQGGTSCDDEAEGVMLDVAMVARRARIGATNSGGVTVMASWYDGGTEMGSWNHCKYESQLGVLFAPEGHVRDATAPPEQSYATWGPPSTACE